MKEFVLLDLRFEVTKGTRFAPRRPRPEDWQSVFVFCADVARFHSASADTEDVLFTQADGL